MISGTRMRRQSYIDPLGLATCPDNGIYNSFFDFVLDPSDLMLSDAVQFNRANKAFIKAMNKNPAFRKDMLRRYPDNKGGRENWGGEARCR